MIRRFLPTVVVTEGPSQGWGDLFDVQPLLTGEWHHAAAEACCRVVLAGLEGRRVVFVGRTIGVNNQGWHMPPMRWLQMGRAGEPAEVMWLPGPIDPWRNNPENRALVDAWLATERKRADKIERAWCSIPNTEYRYSFVRGKFGIRESAASPITGWGLCGPRDRETLRRSLTAHVKGVNRWGGGGWDDLRHSMLVRAALPPGAGGACKCKALMHDHHEHLVSDLSTPLKGIIGDAWRECEQAAEAAVERVFELEGLTGDDRVAVKVADQVALRIEARALGFGHLGDPGELHNDPGRLEWMTNCIRALPDSQVVDAWWAAWREDGG